MPSELLIEPINSFELPPDELVGLANELAALVPEHSVAIGYEDEEGAGVTWVLLLHMFLPSAEFLKDAAYTTACGQVISYFKERRKRPHQQGRKHPLVVHDDEGN